MPNSLVINKCCPISGSWEINPKLGAMIMKTNYRELSELDVLRMAERERGEAIAAFFHKLFAKRDHKNAGFTGGVVAAE